MEDEIIKTQLAIKLIKDEFQKRLSKKLNLLRVSAPLIVKKNSKLNDYLGLEEKPITFYSKYLDEEIEIVQSLAKWKRLALYRYNFKPGYGIYTDMNAIRPNENLDNTHSFYVDQWDWEKVIRKDELNNLTLESYVRKIYQAIFATYKALVRKYPKYKIKNMKKDVFFTTSEKLEKMYPELLPSQREDEIAREKNVVFIEKIGYNLEDGKPHSIRAFDYDDWNLNGDLIIYHQKLNKAIEISSMGIRVNSKSLIKQKEYKQKDIPLNSKYYELVLSDKLFTIGGGIGQSRLCQYLLNKEHIGEVQASIWENCENINLL